MEEFKRAERLWIERAQETVTEGPDPNLSGAMGAWVDPEPLPDEVALLVGDCLQCLRTTLDHLAFELATSFSPKLSDEDAETSQFPIFGDVDRGGNPGTGSARFHSSSNAGVPNRGSGLYQTQFMDPKAQACIESLQPYYRGNAFDQDPVWRLNELNRIDKHRVAHVAATAQTGASIFGPRARNLAGYQDGVIEVLGGLVEGRTQIARWTGTLIPIDPSKPVRMNPDAVMEIVFDAATPLVGGASVTAVLTEMNDHIVSDVLPPLVGFLK